MARFSSNLRCPDMSTSRLRCDQALATTLAHRSLSTIIRKPLLELQWARRWSQMIIRPMLRLSQMARQAKVCSFTLSRSMAMLMPPSLSWARATAATCSLRATHRSARLRLPSRHRHHHHHRRLRSLLRPWLLVALRMTLLSCWIAPPPPMQMSGCVMSCL